MLAKKGVWGMKPALSLVPNPELIFGIVAPIGVDLDMVTEQLIAKLREMEYATNELRLTKLMRELPIRQPICDTPYVQSYKDRISFANEARKRYGDDALAALAISAVRAYRAQIHETEPVESGTPEDAGETPEERPVPGRAYVIRQLKRPEEVALLRSVYGRQFIQISAFSPERSRIKRIESQERSSRGGLVSEVDAHNIAFEIVSQDAKENLDDHGQRVRDAFPLGDVFIDASTSKACSLSLDRFVKLLFGSNEIGPTRDEYGMYMAKSASLRSLDLSRQVGAAVFRSSGEIITMGCNEVPKAGGGTYWSGDDRDQRDIVDGSDPNERRKTEVLVDVIDRLKRSGFLSEEIAQEGDAYQITKKLLENRNPESVSESKVMDLLEFGRIIHAEMSALTDAARKGLSVQNATLYCTTFPCHMCAKHIVASGIARVVYLEPYPKSFAAELHGDSIQVEDNSSPEKIVFEPFVGIAPFRYRDLFEKGKRKYSGGLAQRWNRGERRPMVDVFFPAYFIAETQVAAEFDRLLQVDETKSLSDDQEALSTEPQPETGA
ncbi:Deoxycytidylate deaminase [Hyphomicrobiales bacterium]|nr:Deoxycytidylate deaminase [Hyphomicrobiales bacterium]CAH1697255.1 Deoxycytidylate deaminase [Hyphomicrobiales bacterium]CAI0342823.1 Deoxycytidylate deaminase [Hyphomicrobiales bacterium]